MAFVGNCQSVGEAHGLRFDRRRHALGIRVRRALGIDRIPKKLDVLLRRQNRFEAQTRLRQLGPGDLGGPTLPSGFVVVASRSAASCAISPVSVAFSLWRASEVSSWVSTRWA